MADRRRGIQWDSHRLAQQSEDVDFLVASGSTLEAACRRVGVDVETYTRRSERHRDKESAA